MMAIGAKKRRAARSGIPPSSEREMEYIRARNAKITPKPSSAATGKSPLFTRLLNDRPLSK